MNISITSFAILLTSFFATLKLLGFIAYGWLFVLSPLIFIAGIVLVFLGVMIGVGILALLVLGFMALMDVIFG